MGRKCTDFGDVSQADKALSDSYWKTFANCSIRLSLNWKRIANSRSTKHGRKIPSMNNGCTIDGAIFQFACNIDTFSIVDVVKVIDADIYRYVYIIYSYRWMGLGWLDIS